MSGENTTSFGEEALTDRDDNTIAVLSSTSDGNFAGAVMPMVSPLDTRSQWQHLLDGLFGNVIATDPEANLDGMYAFTWWAEAPSEGEGEHSNSSGLILTRISDSADAVQTESLRNIEGLLGLMLVIEEEESGTRTVVLGLRGYSSKTGKIRPDRVFASVLDSTGEKKRASLDKGTRRSLNLLGKELIKIVDDYS